jgi:hypothetical protein
VVKHLNAFPDDSVTSTLENVFHFDSYDSEMRRQIAAIFQKHGIPLGTFLSSPTPFGHDRAS